MNRFNYLTSGSEEKRHLLGREVKNAKFELMLRTKVEVQHVLNYQIENSCDEKLLKLMANRVKNTTKSKDLELAADVVS